MPEKSQTTNKKGQFHVETPYLYLDFEAAKLKFNNKVQIKHFFIFPYLNL